MRRRHELRDRATWGERARLRLWREACFAQAVLRHRGLSLVILVALLASGGGLFLWLEPDRVQTLPQAMYYAWSLIFGEPPQEFPSHPALQALFFLVPLVGLTVILEAMVEIGSMARDRRTGERGWGRIMAHSMSDHVVVVGMGRLGYRTFHLLRRLGVRVVVLESNPQNQFLDEVRREGSPLLVGDARREAMLQEANVARARAIVLATSDDLANLEIALDARKLAPDIRVVVRMFDQNMADKIGDGFNLHTAMSQASLSAPTFATAAVEPDIISSSIIDGRLIVMQRWQVRQHGALCSRTVAEVMTELHLGVVELRRPGAGPALFPAPDMRIEAGDELVVHGPFEQLAALKSHGPRRP